MIEIFTDGSARNKRGGWGWIAVLNGKKLCSGHGKCDHVTHQVMEILAVIRALETFELTDYKITVYSDSAYVVNCMNDKWYKNWEKNGWMTTDGNEVKNIEYWERLLVARRKIWVKFKHVKAHQTNSGKLATYNNFADTLASRRLKR